MRIVKKRAILKKIKKKQCKMDNTRKYEEKDLEGAKKRKCLQNI
jgi:hypothetical protein